MATERICFGLPIGRTLGGSNIWSARMCGHLQALGQPTALVVHTNPGWHPDGVLPVPPETVWVDCPGPSVMQATPADIEDFARRYETLRPAIMVPNWADAAYASCACVLARHPDALRVIGVAHGNAEDYYRILSYYEPIISEFIAVSDEIAATLARRIPHRRADIHTRACAVDVREAWDRPARAPQAPLQLTYAGRLTNFEKRVSNLPPLMAELDRLGVDFHFRLIGEGGYRATLEQELARLPASVRQRVRFEGLVPPARMPAIWRESDICVLVSDSEGTSITMLEAMAEGCVPVVTRVSGTAAVIEDGVNGCVVEVRDMPHMARRIADIARDRARLDEMGRAAHRKILQGYSYRDYVPWFLALVEQAKRKPRPVWPAGKPFLPPVPPPATGLKKIWQRLAQRVRPT